MPSPAAIRFAQAYVEVGLKERIDRGLRTIEMKLHKFAQNVQSIGASMIKTGVLMGMPMAAGVKAFSSYEAALEKVGTLLTEEQRKKYLEKWGDQARAWAIKYGRSVEDVLDGLFDIVSARIPVENALDVLNESLRTSVVGYTSVKNAVKAQISTWFAFRKQLLSTADASDVLFKTMQMARATFDQMADVIGVAASTASMAGVSVEEFGAAYAITTRKLADYAIAATATNRFFMQFVKSIKSAQEAARKFGVELTRSYIQKIGGIKEFFRRFKEAGGAIEDLGNMFTRIRGARAAAAVYEMFDEYLAAVEELSTRRFGVVKQHLPKVQDTLRQQWKRLGSAIKEVGRQIGEELKPAVRVAADWLERMLIKIKDSREEWAHFAKWVGTASVSLTVAGVATYALGKALKVLAFGFTVVHSAVAIVLKLTQNLISINMALKASFVVLTGAAIRYSGAGKTLSDTFKTIGSTGVKAFQVIKYYLAQNDLGKAFETVTKYVQTVWDLMIATMKEAWTRFKEHVLLVIEKIIHKLKELEIKAEHIFKKYFGKRWADLRAGAAGIKYGASWWRAQWPGIKKTVVDFFRPLLYSRQDLPGPARRFKFLDFFFLPEKGEFDARIEKEKQYYTKKLQKAEKEFVEAIRKINEWARKATGAEEDKAYREALEKEKREHEANLAAISEHYDKEVNALKRKKEELKAKLEEVVKIKPTKSWFRMFVEEGPGKAIEWVNKVFRVLLYRLKEGRAAVLATTEEKGLLPDAVYSSAATFMGQTAWIQRVLGTGGGGFKPINKVADNTARIRENTQTIEAKTVLIEEALSTFVNALRFL